VHASLSDSNDVHKGNNPWNRTDFGETGTGIDWDSFFDGADLARQRAFIVWQPAAFTGIAALVRDVPLQTWKDYLAFHLVNHNSAYLSRSSPTSCSTFMAAP
jgi:putative endopeptidase